MAVELAPMSAEEFQGWREKSTREFAEENVRVGYWGAQGALENAVEQLERLLPDGLESENHYLMSVVEQASGEKVGVLWFNVVERGGLRQVYIYDIEVFEPFRRRGYGRGALQALEAEAKALGIDRIGLHVFAHNRAAISLYEKLGYETKSVNMLKTLELGA